MKQLNSVTEWLHSFLTGKVSPATYFYCFSSSSLIQLYSATLPSIFDFRDFTGPCWISMPRVGISFCKGTLEMSSPQPFMQHTHVYSSCFYLPWRQAHGDYFYQWNVLCTLKQSFIWRMKTHKHSPISQRSGAITWLWISTVPVRLYWNWKQFSLRRQGRTWDSSAHVLELSEDLSRWRVLLCVVWGSHDYENQKAGRVRTGPALADKLQLFVYRQGHVQWLQGRDYWEY